MVVKMVGVVETMGSESRTRGVSGLIPNEGIQIKEREEGGKHIAMAE